MRSSFFIAPAEGVPEAPPVVVRHLYVHIPFCPKVCPYCSFYKEASDRNKTQGFLEAVLRELEERSGELELMPETIFFGGGTPSALSTSQLEFLLGGMSARLDLRALREWTLEMNPATVSLEKARTLRGLGVNRISMGVQSWEPSVLEILGRVHDAAQAERSFAILREAGFTNVNLDLMFGVPGQTARHWDDSLAQTVALAPEHISAYCLTYEEDTAFFEQRAAGKLVPDAETDADFFETTMAQLAAGGYEQYEISNYARPGRECAHNLAYWLGADYLGLGPSAFSTCGERRWRNVANTAAYTAAVLGGTSAVDLVETLTPRMRGGERIAFGLRTNRGVPGTMLEPWPDEVAAMRAAGYLTAAEDRLLLTTRGRMVADSIAETFV